jgi:hypothetical protein
MLAKIVTYIYIVFSSKCCHIEKLLQEKGKITLTKYTLSFGIGKYLPGT